MAGPVRVHGGILTEQALSGSLRFFKIAGPANTFQYTVAPDDTTVIVPGAATTGGSPPVTTEFFVGTDQPVPNSAADRILRVLIEKATLVQVSVVSTTEIHVVFENTSFGWADAAAMQTAVQALGTIGSGAVDSNDPPVPDATNTGTTKDLSTATVTEVSPFQLA